AEKVEADLETSPSSSRFQSGTAGLCFGLATGQALHLLVSERPIRYLGRDKDAVNDLICRGQAAALEPEDNVRAARHRSDFDFLVPADQARRHGGVDGVHQRAIAFAKRLDDSRGVNTSGGAEGVRPNHWIVRRDAHVADP